MHKLIHACFALVLLFLCALPVSGGRPFEPTPPYLASLNNRHDLNLPDWGPYTKKYIGLSHIPDPDRGLRFDISVFPGLYRRKVALPNVFFESDYHPWQASPQFEYFSFRHELEWKDQVYVDISYSAVNEQARLIRMECVNNTDMNQNLALHLLASMHFPSIREYSPDTPIFPGLIQLPGGSTWLDALDYEKMEFARPRPQDNLGYDGKWRGEVRDNGFINGAALGAGFGRDTGDKAEYRLITDKACSDAMLYVRYRLPAGQQTKFELSGMVNQAVLFPGAEGITALTIPLGRLNAGTHHLQLRAFGGSAIEFDGFAVVERAQVDSINIAQTVWHPVPEISKGPVEQSILLKYRDTEIYYGIRWAFQPYQVRQWRGDNLDSFFKQMANEHVKTMLATAGEDHYTNIFLRPINIKPKSTAVLYSLACCGSRQEVETALAQWATDSATLEKVYQQARSHVVDVQYGNNGDTYAFSQQRMHATTLCNVVYPVYTQKSYIRHSAPGRWWDCLYTWDSGFIGLGLLELDVQRAVECLNAYVTEPGSQSAFIHHGTPLPVQHYLFLELWQRTHSLDLLKYFYPRLKQYHEFLAGRLGSSTTRTMKSNLLKTWDYFYNSGGWDDLPPQKYVHDNGLEATTTPVVNTAHAIRTAKILKMAATALGLSKDVKAYDQDIRLFSTALQTHSWDPQSGYFGYVTHDVNGRPGQIMKHKDQVNYDMTLDGAYPLVAGICTKEQQSIILNNLKSDRHLWSPVGISAVDQSAPYYTGDGYWNGTVWMAHQWFYWKTMLDLGEADFAWQIARTGLEVWKKETEASYNCMEHFLIETGRGAGWHEFGGLSTPVIMWHSAYFRPGTLTTGFDLWTEKIDYDAEAGSLVAEVVNYGNNSSSSVIVCMKPGSSYTAQWNGKTIPVNVLSSGALSINLSSYHSAKGTLNITRAKS